MEGVQVSGLGVPGGEGCGGEGASPSYYTPYTPPYQPRWAGVDIHDCKTSMAFMFTNYHKLS